MSGLTLRRAARKVARLETRWGRAAYQLPAPAKRRDRIAERIRRLCERAGDRRTAETWRWLGVDP